jgi:hypothetical protein
MRMGIHVFAVLASMGLFEGIEHDENERFVSGRDRTNNYFP